MSENKTVTLTLDLELWSCQIESCKAKAPPQVRIAEPVRHEDRGHILAPTQHRPYKHESLDLHLHVAISVPYGWYLLNGRPLCDFHHRQHERIMHTFLVGTRSSDDASMYQHTTMIETGMPRKEEK